MINAMISPSLILIPVGLLIIIVSLICFSITKRKKQIDNICDILMENNYIIDQKYSSKREILSHYENKKVVIKIIIGGKNKGLVITNKDTYFMRLYKDTNSSHIDSWKLDDVKTFINQYREETRIIIVLGGYARITKYINENELEAVTIKNDAFGTKILSLEDFKLFIKGE